ncbi:MAG: hypothetical protein GPJ14_15865 [Microcystis aeruginosa G11-01]|jgi:hypothetical protein|nr:hypothetical protein [Microcystis aeruginosa G11-01]
MFGVKSNVLDSCFYTAIAFYLAKKEFLDTYLEASEAKFQQLKQSYQKKIPLWKAVRSEYFSSEAFIWDLRIDKKDKL